jgi:hypothetical protein
MLNPPGHCDSLFAIRRRCAWIRSGSIGIARLRQEATVLKPLRRSPDNRERDVGSLGDVQQRMPAVGEIENP